MVGSVYSVYKQKICGICSFKGMAILDGDRESINQSVRHVKSLQRSEGGKREREKRREEKRLTLWSRMMDFREKDGGGGDEQ